MYSSENLAIATNLIVYAVVTYVEMTVEANVKGARR